MVMRADHLPENALIAELQSIETDLNTLKTSNQPISAGHIAVVETPSSGVGGVDISAVLTANQTGIWSIAFTPAVGSNAFAQITYYLDAPSGWNGDWLVADVDSTSLASSVWKLGVTNSSTAQTITVTFDFWSMSAGTYTIRRLL